MMEIKIDDMSKEEIEKVYNSIPADEKKILQEKTDMLVEVLPIALMAKAGNNSLENMMQFGYYNEKYCKKFNCSPFQFIQDLQVIEKAFIAQSIENGFMNSPVEKKHNNFKKSEKKESYIKKTFTIGDALKEKGIKIKNEI